MRPLTIDLGARALGWACSGAGGVVHGLVLMPGIADFGVLYRAARNTVERLILEHRPDRLGFVPMFSTHKKTSTAVGEALAGLQAMLLLVASDNDLPALRLSERTARKAVLGVCDFGRNHPDTGALIPGAGREMAKEAVMEWCACHGYAPLSHDVGDALVLLTYLLNKEAYDAANARPRRKSARLAVA
jgi:hypothetical protein